MENINNWIFEISSGYNGYRNTRTQEWIYEEEYKKRFVNSDKDIEEAANKTFTKAYTCYNIRRNGFITGAKSPEAKAYHTKDMYSKSEVKLLIIKASTETMKFASSYLTTQEGDLDIEKWFEQHKKK